MLHELQRAFGPWRAGPRDHRRPAPRQLAVDEGSAAGRAAGWFALAGRGDAAV